MTYALLSVLMGLLLVCVWYWQRYRRLQHLLMHLRDEVTQQLHSHPNAALVAPLVANTSLSSAIHALLRILPRQLGIDSNTGLPNRRSFKRAMLPLMPVTQGTLLLLDIQRLRFVNDLFGFHVGDKLLQGYAYRLCQYQPKAKFIVRMGSDEFLLFFPHQLSWQDVTLLQRQLQQPYVVDSIPIGIKVQMGMLALAQHHGDVSLMLKRVDLALKKAMQSPQGIACYEQDDDRQHLRELHIINSLPKALQSQQLYLLYQPKEDLASGGCEQVEALLRWEHPQLGQLSPAEFIPLAECAGMMSLISQWVLEQVLQQQQRWRAQGVMLRVAVNMGGSDFEQDIVAQIMSALVRYQLPGEVLALEITEGVLIANLAGTCQKLQQLRQMGIEIAIDDFGTGHSSLAYLKALPVDEIKIDKMFIDDLLQEERARRIVLTTIEMAHHLGFRVVVEGVESPQQRELLRSMGADQVQGMLFATPMRPAELASHGESLQIRHVALA